MTVAAILVATGASLLLLHGLFSLWLMLYAWDQERVRELGGPQAFREPRLSFAALIPAREEERVIGETIRRASSANYPRELLSMIVICQRDDAATIEAATGEIEDLNSPDGRIEIYDEPPFNKPHALKVGFAAATADVVAVFDAEDDVHPDIFNVVNTVMLARGRRRGPGRRAADELRDHWFSLLNCLEYFFCFQSRLHFHARAGMVPLGGNTVFIRRRLLALVGGWDIDCLTEDADLGVRLCVHGRARFAWCTTSQVTREETPHNVAQLVRQRTRWNQGFLQVLAQGRLAAPAAPPAAARPDHPRPAHARRLPAPLHAVIPVALLYLKLPVPVALLSFAPLYVVGLQMLTNLAVVVASRASTASVCRCGCFSGCFTYVAYQWLIAFSVRAMRAPAPGEVNGRRPSTRAPTGAVPTPAPAPAPQPIGLSESAPGGLGGGAHVNAGRPLVNAFAAALRRPAAARSRLQLRFRARRRWFSQRPC